MNPTAETPKDIKLNLNAIQKKFNEWQTPAINTNFVEFLSEQTSQAILDWMVKIRAPQEVIDCYHTFCCSVQFLKDDLKSDGKISEWNNESAVEIVVQGLNALAKMDYRF